MAIRELNSSPGLLIFTHAWGSGGCAALASSFSDNLKESLLFATGLIREGGAPARGTISIFALELFVVVAVARSLESLLPGSSVLIFVGNDAAAQALAKGGPKHPLARPLAPGGPELDNFLDRAGALRWQPGGCPE